MSRIFSRLSARDVKNAALLSYGLNKNFTAVEDLLTQMIRAVSRMNDLAPVTITADYTGVVDPAAQLPLNIQAVRTYNGTDVSADSDCTWDIASETDAVTATIDADGLIEITAAVGSDVLTVTSAHLNVELSKILAVTFSIAVPPSTDGSGGGVTSSAYDTSFASFNSTTHAAVTDELSVMVAASGNVALSAPLTVTTAAAAPNGTFEVFGKWQWWNGAAWADVGAEAASDPDVRVSNVGFLSSVKNGTLSVARSKTGLTPAGTEKFRFMARNSSGTRVMYLSGTASAVSS